MSGGVAGEGQEISAAALAAQIKGFVKELPAIDTVRDAIRRELQEQMRIAREQRQVAATTNEIDLYQKSEILVKKANDKGIDR